MSEGQDPWPGRRATDGGVDRIPTPDGTGRLWLCGKHAIGPDPQRLIDGAGGATVVCLTQPDEILDRYPDYVRWLGAHDGTDAVWWPIHDLHAPAFEEAFRVVDDLADRLRGGESIVVHCGAGRGRAGTIAICILIRLGVEAEEATHVVSEHRALAGPEAGAQQDLVDAVARASR